MKVAIVVLADTETHESLGRVVNALEAVKEFKEGGDEVQLIFDGAGTKWVVELSQADHKVHALYEAVKDKVTGVCSYCANAFGGARGCGRLQCATDRRLRGPPELQETDCRRLSGDHFLAGFANPAEGGEKDT